MIDYIDRWVTCFFCSNCFGLRVKSAPALASLSNQPLPHLFKLCPRLQRLRLRRPATRNRARLMGAVQIYICVSICT